MSAPSAQTLPRATLVRGLTLIPAMALIVTNVIGSGFFFKTRVMVCNVGSPTLALLDGAASIAAIAVVVVLFGQDLFAATLNPVQAKWATAALILLITCLNLTSVQANGRFATVLTVLKVLLVTGVAVAALAWGGHIAHFAQAVPVGRATQCRRQRGTVSPGSVRR